MEVLYKGIKGSAANIMKLRKHKESNIYSLCLDVALFYYERYEAINVFLCYFKVLAKKVLKAVINVFL